jgi:hypothetical protein
MSFTSSITISYLLTRLKTHRLLQDSKLISTGVNNVSVRPTMNKLSTMLFQVVTVEQCCNNMLTILFIVGRTTLFAPVDINLQQVVDFLNFYACSVDSFTFILWYYPPCSTCPVRRTRRKPTTFDRALTDRLSFLYESVARIEPTNSEVKALLWRLRH